MNRRNFVTRLLAASCVAVLIAAGGATAQQQQEYQPEVGQPGKDVVWVPTPQALVDKMFDMAKATPEDYVIDLGSGDGRMVITAAKRGIEALGIEYNPDLVELSTRAAQEEGVSDKAKFVKADIFETDFSRATVLTLFLLPNLNIRLRPTILDLEPGTRVVSNTFDMGDWTPDETANVTEGCQSYCRAFLWIVPAKVEGTWRSGDDELVLEQKYQMLSGRLGSGGDAAQIAEGRLDGREIAFQVGDTRYSGRVDGDIIEGTAKTGDREESWRATRQRG